MAHLIDMSNGRENMAYTGAKAWHGLGQALPADATIEQWRVAAGLTYDVKAAPVQYMNGSMHTFTGKMVLYRDDTNAPLGVVSDGYKIVQPAEVLEFFRNLCELNKLTMETAGALKGGAIYWALAKTGHELNIAGDSTKGYVLLSTSADGSRATDARFTSVRVVCNNTLTIANHGNSGIRTRHSTRFDADATKAKLGIKDFESSWDKFAADMRKLCEVRVSSAEASEFFSELLRPSGERAKPRANIGAQSFADLMAGNAGFGESKITTDKGRAIRGLDDLKNSYYCAPGAVPGTAYGLVQGVTHFIDHVRGSDDNRQTSAWFGQGDTLKNTAMQKALAMV